MSFDEWVESNKTASGIQELANDDCVYACREAWNYQQAKIDELENSLNSCFELAQTQLKIMQELSK